MHDSFAQAIGSMRKGVGRPTTRNKPPEFIGIIEHNADGSIPEGLSCRCHAFIKRGIGNHIAHGAIQRGVAFYMFQFRN
ncbi:hypothetical protein [Mesorhizobium sp.]|uniref:hypothetical protein n=1 Tax=Mesorhizobium sp. TaxID=1871066 RepID=UPI0025D70010|nr:hypothetical protein [Mesorhizobium sp.]